MNSLDYFVLIVLGASAIVGYYKGFISVLGGFASTLAAVVIAAVYRDNLALVLDKEFSLKTIFVQAIVEKIPQPVVAGPYGQNLVPSIKDLTFVQNQLTGLAETLLTVISFVLLFIIVSFVLKLLWNVLEASIKKGGMGGINRLAGLALLAGKNLMIMAILLGLLAPFVKNGVNVGMTGLTDTNLWIEQSRTAPLLLDVFTSLEKLLGF